MSEMRKQQVPTRNVSIRRIMSRTAFELGAADVRAGRGFRPDYDCWPNIDNQWDYERGRCWGLLAPRDVRLKRNGKVTEEAMDWALHHSADIP